MREDARVAAAAEQNLEQVPAIASNVPELERSKQQERFDALVATVTGLSQAQDPVTVEHAAVPAKSQPDH